MCGNLMNRYTIEGDYQITSGVSHLRQTSRQRECQREKVHDFTSNVYSHSHSMNYLRAVKLVFLINQDKNHNHFTTTHTPMSTQNHPHTSINVTEANNFATARFNPFYLHISFSFDLKKPTNSFSSLHNVFYFVFHSLTADEQSSKLIRPRHGVIQP